MQYLACDRVFLQVWRTQNLFCQSLALLTRQLVYTLPGGRLTRVWAVVRESGVPDLPVIIFPGAIESPEP